MIGANLRWAAGSAFQRALFRYGLSSLAVLLFLVNLRRAGVQVGRTAERLAIGERNHVIHRRMLDAASRRPADRDALADRLRDGRF